MIGLEPITCWLQISCSANWATSAYSLSPKAKWMEVDSNHRSNLQQIYSLSPLATRESAHNTTNIQLCKPMIGLEPITCWLQISCSANWATSAKNKWDLQGSNLWPSACKADALPAELRSQLKRPGRDSNPRPPPWQGGALTNWATRPF